MNTISNFINNEWQDGKDVIRLRSPLTHQLTAKIMSADEVLTIEAITSAKKAVNGSWAKFTLANRIDVLYNFAQEIHSHHEQLEATELSETGHRLFNYSTVNGMSLGQLIIHIAETIRGSILQQSTNHKIKPIGLVYLRNSAKYSLQSLLAKITAILSTGNSLILNPSIETAQVCQLIADALAKSGVPKGVFALINGRFEGIGTYLINHPDISAVDFCGNNDQAKQVLHANSEHLRPLKLQIENQGYAIITNDIDVDKTISTLIPAMFYHSGQACNTLKHLYIDKSIYHLFIDKLTSNLSSLQYGEGDIYKNSMGPIASLEELEKTHQYLSKLTQNGVKILFQKDIQGIATEYKQGNFYPVTLVEIPISSEQSKELRISAPIVALSSYSSEKKLIEHLKQKTNISYSFIACHNSDKCLSLANQLPIPNIYLNNWNPQDTYLYANKKIAGQSGDEPFTSLLAFYCQKQQYLH